MGTHLHVERLHPWRYWTIGFQLDSYGISVCLGWRCLTWTWETH